MNEEKFGKMLQTTSYDIPESYYDRIDNILNDIRDDKVSCKKKKLLSYGYVKVAVIVLAFALVSGTTYAAVNMYQKRMDSISEADKKKYNDDIQNNQVEVDGFSRNLSKEENEKMMSLRTQYEKEGKFPISEIKQLENKLDEKCDYVYFVSSESAFYIPDRTLTEEELLEIIDLQEKRDYSLRSQNSTNSEIESESSKESERSPEETDYLQELANIFDLDAGKLSVESQKSQDGFTESIIKAEEIEFTVYSSENNGLSRIMLEKAGIQAHSYVNKLNQKDIDEIKECVTERVSLFTKQNINKMELYYLSDQDNNLISGTVSAYCYMADGKGCVVVYSIAYKDIYDIYVLDDSNDIKDMVKQKIKSAQGNENEYVKI